MNNKQHAALNFMRTQIAIDAEDLAEHLDITTRQAGVILRTLKDAGIARIVAPRDDVRVGGKVIMCGALWALEDDA
jgi:hypothetical protein